MTTLFLRTANADTVVAENLRETGPQRDIVPTDERDWRQKEGYREKYLKHIERESEREIYIQRKKEQERERETVKYTENLSRDKYHDPRPWYGQRDIFPTDVRDWRVKERGIYRCT